MNVIYYFWHLLDHSYTQIQSVSSIQFFIGINYIKCVYPLELEYKRKENTILTIKYMFYHYSKLDEAALDKNLLIYLESYSYNVTCFCHDIRFTFHSFPVSSHTRTLVGSNVSTTIICSLKIDGKYPHVLKYG